MLALSERRAKSPRAPLFIGAEDRTMMVRPSQRQSTHHIIAANAAIFAKDEKDMKSFLTVCKRRKIHLSGVADGFEWPKYKSTMKSGVEAWKKARVNGAAKIGANISAERKKAKSAASAAKIKDRWPLSSDEWPTKVLLKEAGISLNTAKIYLGRRPIEQANYKAKLKRAKRRQEAGRV